MDENSLISNYISKFFGLEVPSTIKTTSTEIIRKLNEVAEVKTKLDGIRIISVENIQRDITEIRARLDVIKIPSMENIQRDLTEVRARLDVIKFHLWKILKKISLKLKLDLTV